MTLLFFVKSRVLAFFVMVALCYFFWGGTFRPQYRLYSGIVARIYYCAAVLLLLYIIIHMVGSWGVGGCF